MTTTKSFCLFLIFCLFTPKASAIIAPTSVQSTISVTKTETLKQLHEKTKIGFFQKHVFKKSVKKSDDPQAADKVTAGILALASLLSFALAAGQTSIGALLFNMVGIIIAICFLIQLIRINSSKKTN